MDDIEKIRIIWEGSNLSLESVASLFDADIDQVQAIREKQNWQKIASQNNVYVKHDQIGQARKCIKKHIGCSAIITHEENSCKKKVSYEYTIEGAYPYVFICKRKSGVLTSFSYNDVICNRIRIKFTGDKA